MRECERLKEELLRLMPEQSENLQKQTFLGINEQDLSKQEKRFERIRELLADVLDTNDAATFICPHCSSAEQRVHTREEKIVENNKKPSVTFRAVCEKIIMKPEAEKAQVRIQGADRSIERYALKIRCGTKTARKCVSKKVLSWR